MDRERRAHEGGVERLAAEQSGILHARVAGIERRDETRRAELSRDEDPIRSQLQDDFVHVQIAAHTEDLQLYTAAEVEKRMRDKLLRIDKQSHKDEIIDQLVAHADGM